MSVSISKLFMLTNNDKNRINEVLHADGYIRSNIIVLKSKEVPLSRQYNFVTKLNIMNNESTNKLSYLDLNIGGISSGSSIYFKH